MSYSFEVASLYKPSHFSPTLRPQIKIEPDLYNENSPPPPTSVVMSSATTVPAAMHHRSNSSTNNELLKCKKRVQNCSGTKLNSPYSSAATATTLQHSPNMPTSVVRRNERERNRVKMVNMGFATLRQHVPNGVKNKKMSKVETLRSAVDYIRQLQKLLGQTGDCSFLTEDFQLSLDVPSSSGDENCYPPSVGSSSMAPSPVDSSSNLDQHSMIYSHNSQVPYSHIAGSMYSTSPSNHSDLSSKMSHPGTYGIAAISPTVPHHQSQHSHPHHSHHNNSQTSPSPSSVGSDLTSSSSPYDVSMTSLDHHHQHHQTSAIGIRPTTTTSLLATAIQTAVPSTEDELFDFANWF